MELRGSKGEVIKRAWLFVKAVEKDGVKFLHYLAR